MTPMCSTVSGNLVGWATGQVSCDGSTVTIEYFDTLGASQGTTIPANWNVCRPNYQSNSVNVIVEMTQAAYDALGSKDPNTLYVIIG